MNVNLWGPQLWTLLHALAYMTNAKNAHALEGILDDLKILLPCSHCKNSYNEYYPRLKNYKVSSQAARLVYDLHNLVDDKLEKQRLEKFMDEVHAPNKDVMREHFRTLSGRPSFEVVLKRGALSESHLDTSNVWRVLFAFSLAIETDSEKPAALIRWISNLAVFLPSLNLPKTVSDSAETSFAIVWLSRAGHDTNAFAVKKLTKTYASEISQAYAMYKDQLTAGSCRSK